MEYKTRINWRKKKSLCVCVRGLWHPTTQGALSFKLNNEQQKLIHKLQLPIGPSTHVGAHSTDRMSGWTWGIHDDEEKTSSYLQVNATRYVGCWWIEGGSASTLVGWDIFCTLNVFFLLLFFPESTITTSVLSRASPPNKCFPRHFSSLRSFQTAKTTVIDGNSDVLDRGSATLGSGAACVAYVVARAKK